MRKLERALRAPVGLPYSRRYLTRYKDTSLLHCGESARQPAAFRHLHLMIDTCTQIKYPPRTKQSFQHENFYS
jgi:hypothetical protein